MERANPDRRLPLCFLSYHTFAGRTAWSSAHWMPVTETALSTGGKRIWSRASSLIVSGVRSLVSLSHLLKADPSEKRKERSFLHEKDG
jgi:hypothetical protein